MNKTLHPASNTSLIEPLQIDILVEISVDLWIVIQDSSDSNPRFYDVTLAPYTTQSIKAGFKVRGDSDLF